MDQGYGYDPSVIIDDLDSVDGLGVASNFTLKNILAVVGLFLIALFFALAVGAFVVCLRRKEASPRPLWGGAAISALLAMVFCVLQCVPDPPYYPQELNFVALLFVFLTLIFAILGLLAAMIKKP